MQIETSTAVFVGAGTSLLGFFTYWAAKHALDRLLLPRYLDWYARRNRRRAMKRAKQIGEAMLSTWRMKTDARYLMIELYQGALGFLALILIATIIMRFSENEWL